MCSRMQGPLTQLPSQALISIKTVAELAVFQLVKHGAAVVHAVDGDAAVSLHLVGGLEHAAGGGIKARALAVARLHMVGGQLDVLGGQPVAQLVIGQRHIRVGAVVGLGLLGDAGADEHGESLRILLLDGPCSAPAWG